MENLLCDGFGIFSPWLKPTIVKLIVTGTANCEQLRKRMEEKKGRIPITPELLKLIKIKLKASNMPRSRKRTVWLSVTFCWSGGFRIHEILSRSSDEFDPTSTLLYQDIRETVTEVNGEMLNTIRLNIKHPKEARLSAGIILDIFQIKGDLSWMCPIKAWRDWNKDKIIKSSASKPAIRMSSGLAYTGSQFNKDLKYLLSTSIDYSKEQITSHSFQSGLASWMSKGALI